MAFLVIEYGDFNKLIRHSLEVQDMVWLGKIILQGVFISLQSIQFSVNESVILAFLLFKKILFQKNHEYIQFLTVTGSSYNNEMASDKFITTQGILFDDPYTCFACLS